MASTIAEKITALRNTLQMTQNDLADKLQLSRTLVAAWEAGRSNPNSEQIEALAQIFEVSYESLQPSGVVLTEQYDLEKLTENIIKNGELICEALSKDLQRGAFNPVVQEVKKITRRVQKSYETYEWHHPLDEVAHKRFLGLIEESILPYFPTGLVIFSEESINKQGIMEPIILSNGQLGDSAEIGEYVIVDPLDRTAEAIRGIAGFASLTVGSFMYGPLVSIVFCLFDQYVNCYYAITNKGARVKFRNGSSQTISPALTTDLRGACIAAYVGRPIRLSGLTTYEQLFVRHGSESTFVNVSGCYGFCLVASSQVDAFIEVAKGYAWHDIVSGAHILREAGGVVKVPDFSDLHDPFDPSLSKINVVSTEEHITQLAKTWSSMEATQTNAKSNNSGVRRYRFIAAATYDLAGQISHELAKDNISTALDSDDASRA